MVCLNHCRYPIVHVNPPLLRVHPGGDGGAPPRSPLPSQGDTLDTLRELSSPISPDNHAPPQLPQVVITPSAYQKPGPPEASASPAQRAPDRDSSRYLNFHTQNCSSVLVDFCPQLMSLSFPLALSLSPSSCLSLCSTSLTQLGPKRFRWSIPRDQDPRGGVPTRPPGPRARQTSFQFSRKTSRLSVRSLPSPTGLERRGGHLFRDPASPSPGAQSQMGPQVGSGPVAQTQEAPGQALQVGGPSQTF